MHRILSKAENVRGGSRAKGERKREEKKESKEEKKGGEIKKRNKGREEQKGHTKVHVDLCWDYSKELLFLYVKSWVIIGAWPQNRAIVVKHLDVGKCAL